MNRNPMYGLPLAGFFYFNVTTEALGIARGAIDDFAAQLAGRGDRPNLVGRQLRLAESAAELDAAEALIRSDVEVIEHILHEGRRSTRLPGETWSRPQLHGDSCAPGRSIA